MIKKLMIKAIKNDKLNLSFIFCFTYKRIIFEG